jgi:hypothetical protein
MILDYELGGDFVVTAEIPRKALCAFSFIHGDVSLALFVSFVKNIDFT